MHEFKNGRFWPWANGRQITRALRLGAEIVFVFRFHRFELAVREAGGLGAHEVFHGVNWCSKNDHWYHLECPVMWGGGGCLGMLMAYRDLILLGLR